MLSQHDKKYLFVVNPISGKSDASLFLVPRLVKFIEKHGLDAKIEITTAPGDATEKTRHFADAHNNVRVVSCGGDGTLNEIIRAARHRDNVEVCCLPCGTGNDFVLNFGMAQEFLSLERNVINGKAVNIDVVDGGDILSVAICSVGVDADIASLLPRFRRLKLLKNGSMAYNAAIANRLLKPLAVAMQITADDEVFDDVFTLVSIANGKYYGGGICAAPYAKLNDGLIELCMIQKVNHLTFMRLLPKYRLGQHIVDGKVAPEFSDFITFRRVKCVEVVCADKAFNINADGECYMRDRLDVKVEPMAVKFVLPNGIKYER